MNNFILLPLSIIYPYGIYQTLKKAKATTPLTETEEQIIKKKLKTFTIIAIVLSLAFAFLLILAIVAGVQGAQHSV